MSNLKMKDRTINPEDMMHPPAFPEAELEMLAAIIEYPQTLYFNEVSTLTKDDFYKYRNVWESIQAIIMDGMEVNLISVIERMKENGKPALTQDEKDALSNPQEVNLYNLSESLRKTTESRIIFNQGVRIIGAAVMRKPERGLAAAQKIITSFGFRGTNFDTGGEKLGTAIEDYIFSSENERVVPMFTAELQAKSGGGIPRGLMTTLLARPSMGKALHNKEKVLTTRGWQEIGSLKIDDKVYGSDGKSHAVEGIFPQGERDVWIVRFDDETEVRCDESHLWTVELGSKRETVTTGKLQALIDPREAKRRRHKKINRHAVFLPECPTIRHARMAFDCDEYVLGSFVASGMFNPKNKSIGWITNEYAAREIYRRVEAMELGGRLKLVRIGADSYKVTLYSSGLYEIFAKYGEKTVKITRAIAKEFRHVHPENKQKFLMGVVDCAGSANSSTLQFRVNAKCRSSIIVSRYMLDILRSMGFKAQFMPNTGYYVISCLYVDRKKNVMTKYKEIYSKPSIVRAIKERHLKNFENVGTTPNYRKRIVSVSQTTERAEMTCISVSALDKLFITEAYCLTHNTRLLMSQAIHTAQMCKEHYNEGFVQFFSQDGSPDVIIGGYVISRYGYKREDFQAKRVPAAIVRRVREDIEYIKSLPLEFNSDPLLTPSMATMKIKAHTIRYKSQPVLVVADYAQIYRPDAAFRDKNDKTALAVEEFYTMTRQADHYALILASQLPKDVDRRPNKRPSIGDGKNAGEIEERSEMMMGLYREEYYDTGTSEKNKGEVIFLKNKTGERGLTAKMGFYNGLWVPHGGRAEEYPFERDVLSLLDDKYMSSSAQEIFE